MTDYREILRLRRFGLNHSQIAESLSASRTTVIRVLQQARVLELDWPAAEGLLDKELANQLFPLEGGKSGYKTPDYDMFTGRWPEAGSRCRVDVRLTRNVDDPEIRTG